MSDEIVFICTVEGCNAGPWEGAHDAMAHCSEHPNHAYTGRARTPTDDVIPATAVEKRDNRNLHHKGNPRGALGRDD